MLKTAKRLRTSSATYWEEASEKGEEEKGQRGKGD